MAGRPNLVLLGAGGHARVLAETAVMLDWHILGHIAPTPGTSKELGKWLGRDDQLPKLMIQDVSFAIGVGYVNAAGSAMRSNLVEQLPPAKLARLIHPSAVVAPSATLNEGVFIGAGAIVGSGAILGVGSIVNTGGIVEHDCSVGANSHIATGARLAGGVVIGSDVLVGVGAVVRQNTQIDDRAVIGAGAVVLRSVSSGEVQVGNPAKTLERLK